MAGLQRKEQPSAICRCSEKVSSLLRDVSARSFRGDDNFALPPIRDTKRHNEPSAACQASKEAQYPPNSGNQEHGIGYRQYEALVAESVYAQEQHVRAQIE